MTSEEKKHYCPPILDKLTDNELEGLVDMFLAYGELTDKLEVLRQNAIELGVERANLAFPVDREGYITTFIPNGVIFDKVMRSLNRVPAGYHESLLKIRDKTDWSRELFY